MSRLSELERKRDLTRAALNEKLNALEDRVRASIDDARETVKRAVDLQYQVEKRPLIILGCSALMGYFLGRVLFTDSESGESEAASRADGNTNSQLFLDLSLKSRCQGLFCFDLSARELP